MKQGWGSSGLKQKGYGKENAQRKGSLENRGGKCLKEEEAMTEDKHCKSEQSILKFNLYSTERDTSLFEGCSAKVLIW